MTRNDRRLAAVLAADVVGYTRLMEQDSEGTVAAWQLARGEIIDPTIADHAGRIVKHTGDGFLSEFSTVQDAVQCAVEMQQALAAGKLDFRMGIHLGDIIDDGEDIHGEGVNIAARIESLATPGGIFISASVHEQVRNRLDHPYEDMGEHEVKHFSAPVRVYSVGLACAPPGESEAGVFALPDKPSIAVLPFDNMSGDAEQEYFADGMTEDIITDLSKASGLFVIARNSSFAYKGQSPDIRQVCRELGVRHVLEGSVRKAGKRVRISAQLIEGSGGGHIWAERYDRDLEDIFAVQDEVTREIVSALQVELTPAEQVGREGRRKVNPEAFDFLYRGRQSLIKFTPEALSEARKMLEQAIGIDPEFASAYAVLSLILNANYLNHWNDWTEDTPDQALAMAQRACAIDPGDGTSFFALALCQIWRGQLAEAEASAKRSLVLKPNSYDGLGALGQVYDFQGEHEKAVDLFQQAYRQDPHFDMSLLLAGRAQFALGRDDEAEANFRRRLVHTPKSDTTHAYLAALYGATGRLDEARQTWQALMELNPDFDAARIRKTLPYQTSTWFDRFYGGLENAGLPA